MYQSRSYLELGRALPENATDRQIRQALSKWRNIAGLAKKTLRKTMSELRVLSDPAVRRHWDATERHVERSHRSAGSRYSSAFITASRRVRDGIALK